ncbi:hypothetical protein ACO22_05357 [Paracoccidioides brasiliensis]|uniref:Probable aspartic-type endopeptidase CTSD n=1 Tax=Paracoccidioides brasiliensis TaxID=121759 RepID=A0A1D2JAN9_PARBR|nr:hypothetical protein ACO22_05357 [Paracoccidioides brasiliensis]
MGFSSWLLPVALLSMGVAAFYPCEYTTHGMLPNSQSTKVDLKERFFPYVLSEKNKDDVKPALKLDIMKARRQNNFEAFGGDPTTVPHSLPINTDGYDFSYFSTMHFGSNQQPMWMLIDTGASNTWLVGSNCIADPCKIHNSFGSEDSNTLSITDIPFDVTYGSGDVSGIIVNDSVSFAGFNLTMGFGSALEMSDHFSNYPMDGILGLGRAVEKTMKTPTIMQALRKAGLLEKHIIAVNLQRHMDGTKDGQIVFGDIDKTKFTGEISYTQTLANVDHWEILLEDLVINDMPLKLKNKKGIFDTGTSFILVPFNDAQLIHNEIPDSVKSSDSETNFDIPCSTKAKIELAISGVRYTISPKDYVGDSISNSMCRSRIVGHQPFEADEWLLGAAFLKNVYIVFDFDDNRIGLAKRISDGNSTPTGMPFIPIRASYSLPYTHVSSSPVPPARSGSISAPADLRPVGPSGITGLATQPTKPTGSGGALLPIFDEPFWVSFALSLAMCLL